MLRTQSGFRWAAVVVGLVLGSPLTPGRGPAGQSPAAAQQKPGAPPAPPPTGVRTVVEGTDADDRLAGGDGDELLMGGKGNDTLLGGKGRDAMDGGEGDDTLDGGADDDVLDGGAGADTIRGGDGDDTIEGGDDDDLLDGGAGNDNADGGDGNDVIRGGAGDDVLAGGDGDDSLSGGAGADRLSGNDGSDSVAGGAGDDQLDGGEGDDTIAGEAGDDLLDGNHGDDVLRGGAGNDILLGSWGADTLDGGADHDTIVGGDGRDVMTGGPGADWLLGGVGADFTVGGDGDDLIVLRAGDVPDGGTEQLDGGAGADVLVLNGFTLREGVAANGEFRDPLSSGRYRATNVERVDHTHLLTHLGLDAGRPASLVLVNPSATEASVGRAVLFGEDGKPLMPSIRGAAAAAGVSFTVPPLGSVTIDAIAADSPTAAAQLFATVPLGVLSRSTSPILGAAIGEAPLLDSVIIPVVQDRTTTTGAIIVNSVARTRVKLTLRSPDGQELEGRSVELTLPPYGQRTVFLRELMPTLGDFQGTMTIDGGIDRPQEGGPIAVTALHRRDGAGALPSAAIRVSPAPASAPLAFAKFTSGGDTTGAIILVNPSASVRARGTVSFFDRDGRPWPIAINRQAPAASVPFDIAAGGTATFTTAPGGIAQTGSVRAVAAEGAIGGLARVIAPGAQAVDVDAAAAVTAFIAPARRDRAAGITTELAVASTGTAATLQVVLRDQSGAPVSGATTQIGIPANGTIVRTIDELFPGQAGDNFLGTVGVTADTSVTATVLHTGPDGSALVPAIPIR